MRVYAPLMAIFIAGCQTSPPESLNTPPAEWRKSLASDVRSDLKDPYSVREAKVTTVYQSVYKRQPAWAACTSYNAKNGFGAYAGTTNETRYFRSGRWVVDEVQAGINQWRSQNGLTTNVCEGPLMPFPELGQPT